MFYTNESFSTLLIPSHITTHLPCKIQWDPPLPPPPSAPLGVAVRVKSPPASFGPTGPQRSLKCQMVLWTREKLQYMEEGEKRGKPGERGVAKKEKKYAEEKF